MCFSVFFCLYVCAAIMNLCYYYAHTELSKHQMKNEEKKFNAKEMTNKQLLLSSLWIHKYIRISKKMVNREKMQAEIIYCNKRKNRMVFVLLKPIIQNIQANAHIHTCFREYSVIAWRAEATNVYLIASWNCSPVCMKRANTKLSKRNSKRSTKDAPT